MTAYVLAITYRNGEETSVVNYTYLKDREAQIKRSKSYGTRIGISKMIEIDVNDHGAVVISRIAWTDAECPYREMVDSDKKHPYRRVL